MVFLFEDSGESPASKLMKHILLSQRVEYAGSNTKLSSHANKIITGKIDEDNHTALQENEVLLIFVDVVPDNLITIHLFKRLTIEFDSYKNVYVIPWFGMEYHILKVLNSVLQNRDIQDFLSGKCPLRFKDIIRRGGNTERTSKKVLVEVTNTRILCTLNRSNVSGLTGDVSNKFYLQDCACTDCHLSNQCWTVEQKACEIYATLPVKAYSATDYPTYLSQIYTWDITGFEQALETFYIEYSNIAQNLQSWGRKTNKVR